MQSVAGFSTPGHYVLHRKLMTDRFEDIRTFITVVQAKSFAGAAERLAVAKSVISRRVSDLEDRLGTRLLHRTTREVSLTEAGADFYDRGMKLLADLEEAEDLASKGRNNPFGKLRVTAPVSFGINCMSMSARYPRLSVQMEFLDRHTDLVREGFDVAVRINRMKDSSLIARKLAPIRHAVCGSPDYFRKHGKPEVPADLKDHKALFYSYVEPRQAWQFSGSDPVLVSSDFSCNNGDVLREMAVAGYGLAFLHVHHPPRRGGRQARNLPHGICPRDDWTLLGLPFDEKSIGEGAGIHRPHG
jgi:DNA-binding transcriptional LysR family regulator